MPPYFPEVAGEFNQALAIKPTNAFALEGLGLYYLCMATYFRGPEQIEFGKDAAFFLNKAAHSDRVGIPA